MEEKSCQNCDRREVCKFKPDPYMGTHSGGIKFLVPYAIFANILLELYGKYCIYYQEEKKGD